MSLSLEVRKLLMALRTCTTRYAFHIEAIRSDTKVADLPRITYNEEKFELTLDQAENEQVLIFTYIT